MMTDVTRSAVAEVAAPDAYSRREVLRGAGSAVTFGMLASVFGAALPEGVRAAGSAKNVSCMTILYPSGAGVKFDPDYYRDRHLKLITKLYGSSIKRFELRTVPAAAAPAASGGPPPPAFAAAVNIWINDPAAFSANNTAHGKDLVADVPHFTNSMPTIQFDEVRGMAGAPRAAMKIGDSCLTLLYPNSADVRWDADYYRKKHMPLIMRLYGKDAVKRFEFRKGVSDQAGSGKPAYIGTVNIYVNEQKAFDAAGAEHGKTLMADVPHFSSVMPVAFPTVIYGIG